jgi:hypothetical protein
LFGSQGQGVNVPFSTLKTFILSFPFPFRFGARSYDPCAKRATNHDPFPFFLRVIHGSNVCRVRLDSRVIILRPTAPFLCTGLILSRLVSRCVAWLWVEGHGSCGFALLCLVQHRGMRFGCWRFCVALLCSAWVIRYGCLRFCFASRCVIRGMGVVGLRFLIQSFASVWVSSLARGHDSEHVSSPRKLSVGVEGGDGRSLFF